jgi:hypothetical protein
VGEVLKTSLKSTLIKRCDHSTGNIGKEQNYRFIC